MFTPPAMAATLLQLSFFTQNPRQQASEAYPYAFAQRAADGEFVFREAMFCQPDNR